MKTNGTRDVKSAKRTEGKSGSGEFMKMKAVQSLAGAIVLTALMKIFGLFGYGYCTWMLFLPLLLFFALGADMKKIPSMFVCFCCGIAWCYINSGIQALFDAFTPAAVAGFAPTVLVIFLILVLHEGVFRNTILGNIPALFLGMSEMFGVFMLGLPVNGLHLIGFYAFGLLLCVALIMIGSAVCFLVFGKERVQQVLFAGPKSGAAE